MIKPKEKKIKRQEELNVLIRSWLRITSLHVGCIPDIRWKDNFSNFYNLSKPRSSLSHVGCARDANIFPSYNQFLTLESLTRHNNLEPNIRWWPQINKQTNKNHHRRCTDTYCYLINVYVNSGLTQPVRPTLDSLVKTHRVSLERPWLILLEVRV